MRRTIEVRRGDVMHYTRRESKAADGLNLRFFGLRTSVGLWSAQRRGWRGKLASVAPPNFGTAATTPSRHPTGSQRGRQRLERVSGIEPPSSAWKAVALPLSYTRESQTSPTRIRRLCHFRREPNDFNKIS